jgi:hypothetical protein
MLGKLISRLVLSAAVLISFFGIAPVLQSCSEGPEPFSDFSSHPDIPLEKFAAGRIGLVRPTFARSYLVVAYRYFAGAPLTKDEQFGASELWTERIGNNYNVTDPQANPDRPKNPYYESRTPYGRENWPEARKQVTGDSGPAVETLKKGANYSNYVNCSDDALENAAITLNARVKTFGKDHPGVKAWVQTQDTVFAYCSADANASLPLLNADPSLPEIFRYDREYQIAAAYMYRNHFEAAQQLFELIADEKNSPYRDIARYLIARVRLRRSTFEPETLENTAAYIRAQLAAHQGEPYSFQLQQLLDRAEFHLHPAAQTVSVSQRLRTPAPEGKFYQWLWDYTMLLDLRRDARSGYFYDPGETDPQAYRDATPERQKDELTDWILTFQANNESATAHALQVWHSRPDSLPWLLALLSKTQSSSPFSMEVLAAADRIPPSSSAYISAFYHRMRLRNAAKQFADVRKSIDALFRSSTEIPRTSKEDLLDLRTDAASDLEDAVHFVTHSGCLPEQETDTATCTQVLSPHGADVLNSLPLDSIVQAYLSPALAPDAKTQMARNIWMRAVILNRHDVAQKLDKQISAWSLTPQGINPEYITELVKQYEAAASPEEKQFAALFLLQHQYAFGYEMGSTQAWCASPAGPWHDDPVGRANLVVLSPPSFLTPEQTKQAGAERTILDGVDSQGNYYTKVAIEFAQKHPEDPRVPESLSRAVKNTRMNCNNSRTGELSKKAFDLLHGRYPNTSWAKNTKYWY